MACSAYMRVNRAWHHARVLALQRRFKLRYIVLSSNANAGKSMHVKIQTDCSLPHKANQALAAVVLWFKRYS
jgi:hypothetical protein